MTSRSEKNQYLVCYTHAQKDQIAEYIRQAKGTLTIEVKHVGTRTAVQNAAMHLYFQKLADALNDAGLDIRRTLREDYELPWDKDSVKKLIWKPIQEAMKAKESTTELNKMEIGDIYAVINRHMGQKHGIYVAWPCIEELEQNR